ncbi:hypothetical protein LINPERHAP2_LOCUS25208 [Linum perenne]
MPQAKESMSVGEIHLEESVNVTEYLQRKDDDRAIVGKTILEEIMVIRQNFAGKVIGDNDLKHVERNSVVCQVQKLIVTNASGAEVDVSLWAELSCIFYVGTIIIDDQESPVIVGFAGFRIGSFDGVHHQSQTNHLHPSEFNTLEKLQKHVEDSYRTIHELHVLHAEGGDSEHRYHCKVMIVGFDRQQHWCYRACPHCSSDIVANGNDYWCANHDTIVIANTEFIYRIRVYVFDATSETIFVLLHLAAERIIPLSITLLARSYPNDYDNLPPLISVLHKQSASFEVQLPCHVHVNAHGDFKVSRAWDLVMNRSQLVAQFPPPPLPPPRSPRSTSGPSYEIDSMPLSSLFRPNRSKASVVLPPTPSLVETHHGPNSPILSGTTKVFVVTPCLTPLQLKYYLRVFPPHLAPASLHEFVCISMPSLHFLGSFISQSPDHPLSLLHRAASPLAKVNQECLSNSPTNVNPSRTNNTQTSSSLSR